jgi:light-regulated signal transduction histidine kinase (bacteriophytochrome)
MTAKKALPKSRKNEMPELAEFKRTNRGQLIGQLMIARQQIAELKKNVSELNSENDRKWQEIAELRENLNLINIRADFIGKRVDELNEIRRKEHLAFWGIAKTLVYLIVDADLGTPNEILKAFKLAYDRLVPTDDQQNLTAREIIADGVHFWMIDDLPEVEKSHTLDFSKLELPRLSEGRLDVQKAVEMIEDFIKS